MVYTPGKRKDLFAIKDQDSETKEIVLFNRGAIIGLGIVLGIVITVVIGFFVHSWLLGIASGIVTGGLAAWIPVHGDKKREKYYSELIETVQDRLEKAGHPLTRRQVMELLYLRDIRADDEHIIFANTANKELVISVCYSKKKRRERPERKDHFEALVVGEPVPAEEPAEPSPEESAESISEGSTSESDQDSQEDSASSENPEGEPEEEPNIEDSDDEFLEPNDAPSDEDETDSSEGEPVIGTDNESSTDTEQNR